MIKVLTFDVFGTLLDYSDCPWIKQYAEEVTLVRKGTKPYRPLSEIFEEIGADWTRLTVKPNVVECLNRLANKFEIVSLSNANSQLAHDIAGYFKLPWTAYLTTEEAECYKPDSRFYNDALNELWGGGYINLSGEACHVAAHPYDLIGAQRMGFKTAFIDWDNDPLTSPANFDFVAKDILSLTDMLENYKR
jgi:2-haloalkanoic acid dehalogenase type II